MILKVTISKLENVTQILQIIDIVKSVKMFQNTRRHLKSFVISTFLKRPHVFKFISFTNVLCKNLKDFTNKYWNTHNVVLIENVFEQSKSIEKFID